MNIPSAAETCVAFLDRLRIDTAEEHSKLECLPISKAIVSPDVNLNQYCTYLQQMYPFVLQVEQQVFMVLAQQLPDIADRKKAQLIQQDLDFLNADLPISKNVLQLPNTIDEAFAFGIAYVLEGSTLGGRYILKNIGENLNLSAENGASYFAGYQNQTGMRWKNFLNQLRLFATEANQQQIIDGARFAFRSLFDHLNYD